MTAETTGALDRASTRVVNPTPVRDSVIRIATMSRRLLEELRAGPLDAAGLNRLGAVDTKIVGELLTDLDPDLRQELQRLVQPLTCHTERSDAELRLAHAQLVGWLEGHLRTAESALSDPHATLAVDGASASSDNTPWPDGHRPDVEPSGPTTVLLDDDASRQDDWASRSARRTLITAITGRITQQRLTAAQAAALLHLTGPKVTKLLQANVDEFTLDELVTLLPALELTIHVVPAPQRPDVPLLANDGTKPTRGQVAT